MKQQGILFLVSGPSGSGKSTLCHSLRASADFAYSVSCTTRPPRTGEVDGTDYHFLDEEEFQRRVKAGEFLEHAQVHGRYHYGTLQKEVVVHLDAGRDVLLEIDVEGARQVRNHPDPVIRASLADIFILPPSMQELERRLRGRGTEEEEMVRVRLATALEELRHWREYRHTIISGTQEEDLERFRAIMTAERCLSKRVQFEL